MTSPTPYLVAENPAVNHYVHLLLTNNNHFEFSIPKDNSSTLSYSKIKKKDYKKPEKSYEYIGEIGQFMLRKH